MLDPHAPIGTCCTTTWTPSTAKLEQSGIHWRASCGACGRYLRFVPQRADRFRFPFGKYKGRLVADVWNDDPTYCEWLLDQEWPQARLRQVLEETRPMIGVSR